MTRPDPSVSCATLNGRLSLMSVPELGDLCNFPRFLRKWMVLLPTSRIPHSLLQFFPPQYSSLVLHTSSGAIGRWNNSLTLISSLKFENLELIEIWTLQSSIGWIWVAGRIGFHPRSSAPCLRETSKDEARDQCNTISDLFVSLLIDAWIHELMMIRLLLTYGVLVMSW